LQAQNINPYDWIEYHVSLFLITFVSIRDEVLLLVNSLFCLGIDPRHCNIFIIKSNKWIKDTTIPKHIESIELVIDSHRKRRNQLVHGGKTPSLNAWFKSANLDQLKAFSLAMQHKPEKISEDLKNKIEAAYVVAITQINRGLESEICQLKAAVWQLLNDAHKVYTERRAIFSTVNGEDPIDPK
jgi:hypothetical protein